MNSKVLKRRLNPFLLASTVLILALLAGLSVLYQGQLSEILSDKKDLKQKIDNKNQEISTLKNEKSNLTEKLTDREQDIESYVSENQQLKTEISSLESDVSELESEKTGLESDISDLNSTVKNLEVELSDINSTLEDICDYENNTVRDGDQHCEDWGHEFEGSEP